MHIMAYRKAAGVTNIFSFHCYVKNHEVTIK